MADCGIALGTEPNSVMSVGSTGGSSQVRFVERENELSSAILLVRWNNIRPHWIKNRICWESE